MSRWPEGVRDGEEAVQVYPGQCPHHQGVDQGHQEAVHPTHAQPRHRHTRDEGRRGEEEEQQAEHRVGDTEVDKQQAAGLPGLNNEKSSQLSFKGIIQR